MSDYWYLGGASVKGISHIETNTPCQDSYEIAYSNDGKWVAVAVCDGAGSAKYSEAGAKLVAQTFAQKLILLSQELKTRTPGNWINDFVIQQVLNVRENLRKIAGQDQLNDYHSTLVACLVGETGGFVIHIGDGAVIGGVSEKKDNEIYLDKSSFISEPQNGEYANETFFITEGDWIKNLRITPLPPLDWMLLGTDGGSSFYLYPSNNLKKDFISSFINEIFKKNPFEWSKRIENVLSDDQANKITNDDKTIVFLAKKGLVSQEMNVSFLNNKNETEEIKQHQDNQSVNLNKTIDQPENVVQLKKKSSQRISIRIIKGLIRLISILIIVAGLSALYLYRFPLMVFFKSL